MIASRAAYQLSADWPHCSTVSQVAHCPSGELVLDVFRQVGPNITIVSWLSITLLHAYLIMCWLCGL